MVPWVGLVWVFWRVLNWGEGREKGRRKVVCVLVSSSTSASKIKEGVVTTHTLFMYIKHNVDSLHALFLELYFSYVIVGTVLPSKVHVVQV